MRTRLFVVVVGCLLLSGCTSQNFNVDSFYVSPWRPEREFAWFAGCLSIDGQSFTFSNLDQVQLGTGEISNLVNEFPEEMEIYPYISYASEGECGWTSDGQLLGFTVNSEPVGRGYVEHVFILNTENHEITRLSDGIGQFRGWSPFSDNVIIATIFNTITAQVYNINLVTNITNNDQVDFRSESGLGGSRTTIWDQNRDYPIAYLTSTISNPYTVFVWPNLAIVSGIDTYPSMESEFVEILSDTPIAGAIFDPTGEYVLISEWVCGSVDENQPCDWNTARIADISDTILSVINWRTGERQEIFRLSDVGDGYFVVYGSSMYWSADGSTILIERYDASPVVLMVQYP
jgi:hypothetical protein